MENGVSLAGISVILVLSLHHKFVPVLANNNGQALEELDELPSLSYGNFIATQPIMTIRSWRFFGMRGSTLQRKRFESIFNDSSGTTTMEILPASQHAIKGDINVTCSAPYPIKFTTNMKAGVTEQSLTVSPSTSNWTATLNFNYPLAGFIACDPFTAENSSNLTTKVQIFLHYHARYRSYGSSGFNLEQWFTYSKQERIFPFKSNQQGLHYLAPCRLNFLKDGNNVTLRPTASLDGGHQLNGTRWDPTQGIYFQLTQPFQHHNWVICSLGKQKIDFFLVKRVDIVTIPSVEFLENRMRITSQSMMVDLEDEQGRNFTFLQSAFWCRWASLCYERLPVDYGDEARDQASLRYELATYFEEPGLPQGIIKYILAPAPIPQGYDELLYFTGLDNVIYKLFDGTYPNVSVIQLEPFYKLPLYKNSTPTFEFTCKALDFVLAPRAYLRVLMNNSSTSMLFTSGMTLSQQGRRRVTDYSFELELDVNMRRIECLGIDAYFGLWKSSGRAIEVKYAYAPMVNADSVDVSKRRFVKGDVLTLDCPISGEPRVEISWTLPPQMGTVDALTGEKPLHLGPVNESHAGNYTCHGVNQYGNASHTITVSFEGPEFTGPGPTLITVAVVSAILVLLIAVLAWKYRSAKRELGGVTEKQIERYLEGDNNMAQSVPQGPEKAKMVEFAKYVSPRDLCICFDDVLGEGQYGIVYSGTYRSETVAVKAFKLPLLNAEQIFSALTEIKLMGYIGDHPNIVKFHGVDISRLRNGQMYMVMEKSGGGSLRSHLVNEMYEQFTETDGENLDKLLESLVHFCMDIASAMEYLEERKIIHGDLATRNVLVFPGNVVKLADFGYARRLYVGTEYVPRNEDELMLAYRWASPELLRNATFSTASDVWAFGVTAWEIFSLGETPFLEIPFNAVFCPRLVEGMRLPKPGLACDEVYEILKDCWKLDPADRPSFKNLGQRFVELAERVEHGDLNFCIEAVNVNCQHHGYENFNQKPGLCVTPLLHETIV